MGILRAATAFLLVAVCATALAAKHDYKAVYSLQAEVALGQLQAMAPQISGNATEAKADGIATNKKLEELIGPALTAAKGHADLVKAIKEYYVAAVAYFESLGALDLIAAANTKRAEAAMNEKETALKLELKLVGAE